MKKNIKIHHLSPQILLFFFLIIGLQNSAFSQKVLKVKGNKLIFSTRSLDVSEDDILPVTSDGFEAGKVKVLKVGDKTALAKIISGSVLVGDQVGTGNGSRSSSGDSSFSSESDDASWSPADSGSKRNSSSKYKSSRYNGPSHWSVFLGYSNLMLADLSTQQGDFALDALTGILLKAENKTGNSSYQFGYQKLSANASFNSKVAAISISGTTVDANQLFFQFANYFNSNFYWTYGAEVSMVNIKDTITLNTGTPATSITGQHTLDLKGLGGIGGVGYNFIFAQNFIVQTEALAVLDYYFLNDSKLPAGANQDFKEGTFLTYGLQFNISVGYKF